MRGTKRRTIVITLLMALALTVVIVAPIASAQIAEDAPAKARIGARMDKLADPLGDKMEALRAKAVEDKLQGNAKGKIYEVEPGQFVELTLSGTGMVWTVPGEFPDYPHNSIPEPDRAVDNSTIWVPDFSEAYFDELLNARGEGVNSMAEFFLEQSSGRYTVDGDVVDWVMVPNGYAYYDDGNDKVDTSTNVWLFLEDTLDGWYAQQLADGKSAAEIDAYLAQFDTHDRYDWDEDGIFDEPDGYIDHFQSMHSGEGEEAGGGELGDQAIWSHSWYANFALIGKEGPSDEFLLGGIKIGDSNYWVGDYTIQPENGGVGVFTHEFTHDLGLPDLYDTNAGENSTGFWTLMSSGSWLSDNDYDIGSEPGHLGAWEKLMLGWLNYTVAPAGATTSLTIGPAEYNSTKAQALVVPLPDKFVEWDIGDPYAGEYFYYSDMGDNLRQKMTKAFTLPAGAQLSAWVNYGIEEDYDYANVIVSTDGGATWQTVPTNLSNSSVEANGIDGFSNGWVNLTADLSAFAGDVRLGFSYITDGGVAEVGFMVDDISISGFDVDGAETDTGWTLGGFKRTTGYESGYYMNFYLAEYRQYWGYDDALDNCYNFGFLYGKDARANWVEHFPYQDGLLVWYCDTSQADNNTSAHPGEGFALPIDAHPVPLTRGVAKKAKSAKPIWRNRVQSYDSTFGLEPTDALVLHYNSKAWKIKSLPAVPCFNDALSYWSARNPTGSVKTPTTGTKIEVLGTATASDGGQYMSVRVTAPQIIE
jgi:immune inhibitor A